MKKPGFSAFESGGGEMGARVRAFDWACTPLGPIAGWPAALRITVDQTLASRFPACLFWGPDLIAIYNDSYRPLLGAKPDALGQPLRVTWTEVWEDLRPIAEKALAGEASFFENFPLQVDRNGRLEHAYFTFNYGPVFDEHGVVLGMLDTVVETTAQVLGERRATEERDRQRALLQQMPGFVGVLSGPNHVFEYVNDAYVEIAGERQFLGRTVRDVFPELQGQGFFEMLDTVFASGNPIQAHAVPIALAREDGNRFIDLLYEPIRDDQGRVQGIFVGGYDVTDRVTAEKETRASESRLRELNADLEQRVVERTLSRGRTWQVSPELLGVINGAGYFEASNPAWQTTLGWSEHEVATTVFFEFIHPEDLRKTQAAWADAMERGLPALKFENRYRVKGGGWRWLSWVAVPEDGKIYCSARDIQDEKEHAFALGEAQEALRQSQKMEAVGQLTGGLAHDFNNLLAAISGSLQVLDMKLQRQQHDGLQRYIDMGERSVRSAAALTQRLLAFSRRQTLDPRPVDVNRLVADMAELIERSTGPAVAFEVNAAPGLWLARVDASQLENALLNLCINACDAMKPAGGQLTVATHNTHLEARAAAELQLPEGDYACIAVTDTGTGMTPEVAQRIFDPFFTTKPQGQGTGLGLSMVYGFVRQSGGQMHVASHPARGTTMSMYLPRHAGALDALDDAPQALPAGDALSAAGETILLVEDEESVRNLVQEMLTEAGYHVIAAPDGPAGVRVLEDNTQPINLLLTDVGLPGGMNGRQVADTGGALRPGLRVLFITGYAEESAGLGNGLPEAGMAVMTKPFEIAALVRKVGEMLGSRTRVA